VLTPTGASAICAHTFTSPDAVHPTIGCTGQQVRPAAVPVPLELSS